MFGKSKEERKREQTRDRVRRYREKKKAVTDSVTNSESNSVTKMICKCQYFKMVNGQLICTQCGRLSSKQKISDKILQAETKEANHG